MCYTSRSVTKSAGKPLPSPVAPMASDMALDLRGSVDIVPGKRGLAAAAQHPRMLPFFRA